MTDVSSNPGVKTAATENKSPGTVLNEMMEKSDLNYNRLAKAIGMSSAMVRMIARDECPISASAAIRLAEIFKTDPEYWLTLQSDFDLAKAMAVAEPKINEVYAKKSSPDSYNWSWGYDEDKEHLAFAYLLLSSENKISDAGLSLFEEIGKSIEDFPQIKEEVIGECEKTLSDSGKTRFEIVSDVVSAYETSRV
jgi:addiction module HigA family antidote